ncbi:M28 family peptidase [Puteibacter caeruleilacunae]|nr:M28 family peptidase [Puteibacter caeruleilacunae]
MMRRILYFAGCLALTACVVNSGQKEDLGITYENIEKHVKELSSDVYKGRAPLTESEELSVNYIKAQMEEMGLEPANNGSFIQEVPLMQVTSKISPTLDFETPKGDLKFNKLTEYVTFSRKVKDEMKVEDSEVIFAGFGITASEYGRDDFDGIDVKGKTIIVFVNDPGYGTQDEYFKGHSMTYYGRWTYKFEEAARRGAKACLIVHETGPAGYPWAVVRNNGESTEFYLQDKDGYRNRCALEGWLTKDAASRLFESCGLTFEKAKAMAIAKDFKPFALRSKVSGWIKSEFKNDISKNVCGLIKGTERPDEVVVYTAHWDHLGVGRVIDGDSIYNGATDNASAVSWLLEIARAFKQGEQPKRSALFLAVTAEESGLLGSSYYAENPIFPMNKTVACINTDVILFLGQFKDVTLTGYGQTELDEWVAKAAKVQDRYVAADPNPENGMYFRSDQFPFVKLGVPAIFAKGYIDARAYGKEKTLELVNNYWKQTYHKPSDEYVAERDNLEGLVEDARLMYLVGYDLATSTMWPNWNEDSEFRAIRDQSMQKTE